MFPELRVMYFEMEVVHFKLQVMDSSLPLLAFLREMLPFLPAKGGERAINRGGPPRTAPLLAQRYTKKTPKANSVKIRRCPFQWALLAPSRPRFRRFFSTVVSFFCILLGGLKSFLILHPIKWLFRQNRPYRENIRNTGRKGPRWKNKKQIEMNDGIAACGNDELNDIGI